MEFVPLEMPRGQHGFQHKLTGLGTTKRRARTGRWSRGADKFIFTDQPGSRAESQHGVAKNIWHENS